MKIKYECDIDQVLALVRHFGLALTLGAVFHGTLESGDLIVSGLLSIIGVVFALSGTLKEKTDD